MSEELVRSVRFEAGSVKAWGLLRGFVALRIVEIRRDSVIVEIDGSRREAEAGDDLQINFEIQMKP